MIYAVEAIIVLIVISLLLGCGFLFAFFWAVRVGQYDDTQTPSMRMLHEDIPQEEQP